MRFRRSATQSDPSTPCCYKCAKAEKGDVSRQHSDSFSIVTLWRTGWLAGTCPTTPTTARCPVAAMTPFVCVLCVCKEHILAAGEVAATHVP
eukprot:5944254-Amphidinium_carterae.2